MVLNQAQGLKKKSHEVSARKNNNRLRYNKKCRGGQIPPPPALLGLNSLCSNTQQTEKKAFKQKQGLVKWAFLLYKKDEKKKPPLTGVCTVYIRNMHSHAS